MTSGRFSERLSVSQYRPWRSENAMSSSGLRHLGLGTEQSARVCCCPVEERRLLIGLRLHENRSRKLADDAERERGLELATPSRKHEIAGSHSARPSLGEERGLADPRAVPRSRASALRPYAPPRSLHPGLPVRLPARATTAILPARAEHPAGRRTIRASRPRRPERVAPLVEAGQPHLTQVVKPNTVRHLGREDRLRCARHTI
jgi:hypothetical protein